MAKRPSQILSALRRLRTSSGFLRRPRVLHRETSSGAPGTCPHDRFHAHSIAEHPATHLVRDQISVGTVIGPYLDLYQLGYPRALYLRLRPVSRYQDTTMSTFLDLLRRRLGSLLPAEIAPGERLKLLTPFRHPLLISRHRAGLIVDRVRLFAFLFAVLTPLWRMVDFIAFPSPLRGQLMGLRLTVCLAFLCLLLFYRDQERMGAAYLAMFILFAIPTLFYIASHTLLMHYDLVDMPAAVAAGYAFLPFVLMAGLALFPLTLLENLLVAAVLLLAQGLAGYLNWSTLTPPSFVGAFWLLPLIAAVTSLASMSQLAYLVALPRRAIRDDLTRVFARNSGEEILQVQWNTSLRNNSALSVAL